MYFLLVRNDVMRKSIFWCETSCNGKSNGRTVVYTVHHWANKESSADLKAQSVSINVILYIVMDIT